MKRIILAGFVCLSASIVHAADCLTTDGVKIINGEVARLYFKQQPRVEIGPNYNCDMTSRSRACENGVLSNQPVECSEYDSGGCVDWWIDRLPDTDFQYGTCEE